MTLKVRTMTEDERVRIERLAHTRTAPAGIVWRAQIIWAASQGQRVPRGTCATGRRQEAEADLAEPYSTLSNPC